MKTNLLNSSLILSLPLILCSQMSFASTLDTSADSVLVETAQYKILSHSLNDSNGYVYQTYLQLKNQNSASQAVNAKIKEALADAACKVENEGAEATGSYLTFETSVVMNSEKVLSLRITGSEYCGGAHPTNYDYFRNFDLKTGDELTLLDILNIKKAEHPENQYYMNQQYLSKNVKSYINAIGAFGTSQDPMCKTIYAQSDFHYDIETTVGITQEALIFLPLMPHAAEGCAVEAPLTYNLIRTLLKPGSVVEELSKAK